MLLSIGKKKDGEKGDGEDLVELLLACHGRIRSFIALAIAVGERSDASDDDVVDAASRVRRYFSDALPLHVEDEEEGVLPRLHGRSPELDAALDRMCEQHDEHKEPLRRVLASCASLQTAPADRAMRAELVRAATELRESLEPHMFEEERVVFTAIREQLAVEDQRSIVGELRARRHRT